MRKQFSTIVLLMLFVSTLSYGQSLQSLKPNMVRSSDTISSSTNTNNTKGMMAVYCTPLGLHFEDGAWAFRQELQFGSYLTDHFSWLIGMGHNQSHADFNTITPTGHPTTKDMHISSLTFPLTLNYTIGSPKKMTTVKLQAGVTYSYVLSMKIGSDKQNLSGMDRGGFYAHLRMALLDLLFIEYDIPFKGGDGSFFFGICMSL